MQHEIRAARYQLFGKLTFGACILLSILSFAFAIEADLGKTATILFYVAAVLLLVLSAVAVALFYRAAGLALAEAKKEAALRPAPVAVGEDGLPAAFCAEIRAYSPAQLRLILDEQEEEYSAEEFAFIKKVLDEKQAAQA